MLFNSLDFALFLPLVFGLYWSIPSKNSRLRNFFILAASYLFYGWWDWRFLGLLAFSSVLDFSLGLLIGHSQTHSRRKFLLWVSLLTNLGLLGFFKYYNFFIESLKGAFTFFGQDIEVRHLHIILPVGISFYTFQSLSYTIDVYRKDLKPTKNLVDFLAFVSFFPQLVAGPIERATHLLPQFEKGKQFDAQLAITGLRQILWGFFKKLVIADSCADQVNLIYQYHGGYSGSTLLVGAILFSFQIYGDFSGYSDIALGTARLFGYTLMQNFSYPYFSRDIAEFWRRWHISLSTWFRDYVYFPLGGSKGSLPVVLRNTFVVFMVSGFWHGANWTFIAWGFINALAFIPLLLFKSNRSHLEVVAKGKILPSLPEMGKMVLTFLLVTLAWVFFRSANLPEAFSFLGRIFSDSLFSAPQIFPKTLFLLIGFLLVMEWRGREDHFALERFLLETSRFLRWGFYSLLLGIIYWFGNFSSEIEFIYFQF